MIHVMPLSSIARITKMDIETLQSLSETNPVFASGADFFYKLGGVEEIIDDVSDMSDIISRHVDEIYQLNAEGRSMEAGPWGRGTLGAERGGRAARLEVINKMQQEFAEIENDYL